jgi:hypothetical protein
MLDFILSGQKKLISKMFRISHIFVDCLSKYFSSFILLVLMILQILSCQGVLGFEITLFHINLLLFLQNLFYFLVDNNKR